MWHSADDNFVSSRQSTTLCDEFANYNSEIIATLSWDNELKYVINMISPARIAKVWRFPADTIHLTSIIYE